VKTRRYRDEDFDPILRIFTESVHDLGRGHYRPDQLEAWAPRPPDTVYWRQRLRGVTTRVAECGGRVNGFLAYSGSHLDLLFVDPAWARQGVAGALYRDYIAELRLVGVRCVTTEASRVARPFFERMGLSVVEEETVRLRGVDIQRFRMAGPVA
jgi:putative acetyltransferase